MLKIISFKPSLIFLLLLFQLMTRSIYSQVVIETMADLKISPNDFIKSGVIYFDVELQKSRFINPIYKIHFSCQKKGYRPDRLILGPFSINKTELQSEISLVGTKDKYSIYAELFPLLYPHDIQRFTTHCHNSPAQSTIMQNYRIDGVCKKTNRPNARRIYKQSAIITLATEMICQNNHHPKQPNNSSNDENF
jgi:hypothetical protein